MEHSSTFVNNAIQAIMDSDGLLVMSISAEGIPAALNTHTDP